jgi:hypothetical protein
MNNPVAMGEVGTGAAVADDIAGTPLAVVADTTTG